MIRKNEAKCGGSVISYKVTRKVLPDEVILSRDLKEVREDDVQITGQKIPDHGSSEYRASKQPCACRNIREGCWGQGRQGNGILWPPAHSNICWTSTGSHWAWGEAQRSNPSLQGGHKPIGNRGHRNPKEFLEEQERLCAKWTMKGKQGSQERSLWPRSIWEGMKRSGNVPWPWQMAGFR